MAQCNTETGYNMFDMLSMLQKSIRRGDYLHAGFAANQLKNRYRKAMWNRLMVISSEDCYGVVTKEITTLFYCDSNERDDINISRAVALLCTAKKSRDACYFACNFVLASRKPREIKVLVREADEFEHRLGVPEGSEVQLSLFCEPTLIRERTRNGVMLEKAINHLDMDMIGYQMCMLKHEYRGFLWDVFEDYGKENVKDVSEEIHQLRMADGIVNKGKKEPDEIFISKAAMVLCVAKHRTDLPLTGTNFIPIHSFIDWSKVMIMPISECEPKDGIPEWVYDCHTLKGKKMGKTDWDMTTTEQAALNPLQPCFFDEASWLYTYEQDLENGAISKAQMQPIWDFAKDHAANPVEVIPYE